MVTARNARRMWARGIVSYLFKWQGDSGSSSPSVSSSLVLVQKAFDRRAGDDLIGRRQQDRLAQLMIPGAHADRQSLVAVEMAVAEDESAQLCEIGGVRSAAPLHDHLDRHPRGPIGAFHVAAAGLPARSANSPAARRCAPRSSARRPARDRCCRRPDAGGPDGMARCGRNRTPRRRQTPHRNRG